jgi:hypothetical protein
MAESRGAGPKTRQRKENSGLLIAERPGRNISLDIANVTVRSVLNGILTAGGGWYWPNFRFGKADRFLSLAI